MAIRRPVLTSLVALALTSACDSSSAPPAAVPTVKLLNSSGDATGRGGDGAGRIVGLGFTASGSPRALLWTSLSADPIELPGRGGYTDVSALARQGIAIGHDHASDNFSQTPIAVRWVGGEREPLGVPEGWAGSVAIDINDLGAVVGHVSNLAVLAPFIWTSGTGMALLALPGTARGGQASGISECGAVAGSITEQESNVERAVVWDSPGAPARELATLPGGTRSTAYDINCDGEVAGYSSDGADPERVRAVKWQANGVPVALPHPAGLDVAFSWADDLDERGNVVGTLFLRTDPGETFQKRRPVLWPAEGGVIDLSSLVPDFVTGYSAAILPDGTIVGTVIDGAGAHAAVWLDFVPK